MKTFELIKSLVSDIINGAYKFNGTPLAINPRNFESKRFYNGINHFILKYFARESDYLTFLQIKKLGFKLKSGSKGIPIIYYKLQEYSDNEGKIKKYPLVKYSNVFRLSDIENFKYEDERKNSTVPNIQSFINNIHNKPQIINANITIPHYNSETDVIKMPLIDSFRSINEYYLTLLHELSHATGHKTRLDRESLYSYEDERGKEELTAELSTFIIATELNNEYRFNQDSTKAYLSNWLNGINENPNYLFKILADAEKSKDYLLKKYYQSIEESDILYSELQELDEQYPELVNNF